MRVAFFVELFPKLSETFILNQATGLLELDHTVRIFADRPADEPKKHPEIGHYNLIDKTSYSRSPRSYTEAFMTIMGLFSEAPQFTPEIPRSVGRGKSGGNRLENLRTFASEATDFDVHHAHFGNTGSNWDFLKTNPAFPTETPFIVSFYGEDASKLVEATPDRYRTLFRNVDAVTVLSEDMKTELMSHGCPESKIHIQPLPINVNKFEYQERRRSDAEPIKVVTVARFDEQKGLSYAVDAIAELMQDYDIEYSIAGDGPLFPEIKAKIEDHGISDSVELLGWLDSTEIRQLMQDSHIFLLPSVTASDGSKEGTPTVLLEAQATGLPVVSTYHAGIPEIVGDEESGLLVAERDTSALVSALEQLFDNPHLWTAFGENGRQRVEENHSIPVVAERLESLYRRLQ